MNHRRFPFLATGIAFLLFAGRAAGQAVVVDHNCTNLGAIPASAIAQAKSQLRIAYGHTSHGSQLVDGMRGLVAFMDAKKNDSFPDGAFSWASSFLHDGAFESHGAQDLGNPNRTAWNTATRSYLGAPNTNGRGTTRPDVNVVIWSWCGQVAGSVAEIQQYLDLMSALERDYPGVKFVYMTGHLDGTGTSGTVNQRNEQIRTHCRNNGKTLYDFADIESYDPDGATHFMPLLANDNCDYDSDGNGTRDRNWATAWQAAHTQNVDWYACSAAHSQSLNGNRKAYAAWWLWARLAGWAGTGGPDTTPPSAPTNVRAAALSDTSVQVDWQAATDNVGVAGYRILRDGTQVGTAATTTFTDSGLAGSTSHAYRVAAVDAAGNVSSFSAAASVTTPAPDPLSPGATFPATLSGTGVFSSLAPLTPTARFFAYEPALPSWGDFATKRSWVARPPAGTRLGYAPTGDWSFPAGTTWVQHFEVETVPGDATTRRRIETRILVRTTNGVAAATYRWNDAQTEAALVDAAGATADLAAGGAAPRAQRWRFPARSDCLRCHTAAAGFAPGFTTAQLNRGSPNQLSALARAGFLDPAPADPSTLPTLARICDAATPLETRARAWLEANCASCHRPGGTAAGTFDARAAHSGALVGGVPHNPGGDPANRLLAAGDPARSLIVQRAGRRDAQAMPPVGSNEPDPLGGLLVAEWARRLAQPAGAAEGRVINLSTRGIVQSGESVLIGGFVIAGSGPKRLLVRGIGPALGGVGISNPLANPQIELFRGNTSIATNEDWGTGADASSIAAAALATGAFPLPAGSRDAALLVTLDPGLYTVHVRGGGAANAIGLFELYETGPAGASRLVNISTRLRLGVGERVAIPGLVVAGGTRRTFLVRSVGPGLRAYGIADALANPRLTLMSGQSAVAGNDDWCSPSGGAAAVAAGQVGAFPLAPGSRDAALLVSLDPGIYTVVTEGDSTAEGVVLVEIYEVL